MLTAYDRLPVHPFRGLAFRRAAEWVVARQEADGGWGGIQPPWVYSILALHLLGYPLEHPVLAAAINGLEGFLVHEPTDAGPVRRLEACQSPVWDTCLAVTALLDAGAAPDDPPLVAAGRWLVAEEIRTTGDWAVRRPGLEPSGWAFEFANDIYPDVDDAAEVVLSLQRLAAVIPGADDAIARGTEWTIGMQSRDGGWAAFDADNTRRLIEQLPFCDFGAVIDPPSADVTAHVVELLGHRGLANTPAGRRGIAWLLRRPGARRVMVRALGRQLRLRDGGGRSGARRRRNAAQRATDPARRAVVGGPPEPQTAAGGRTCARTQTTPGGGAAHPPRRRPRGPCLP